MQSLTNFMDENYYTTDSVPVAQAEIQEKRKMITVVLPLLKNKEQIISELKL